MIKFTSIFLILLTLNGCSFKTPDNDWQYKSVSAFSSYTKNFLSANDALAKNDLKRAIAHAKMSANLQTLASIYLGECALNISVGISDNCQKYKDITDLVEDKKLYSYYQLLTNTLELQEINNLPDDYQSFSKYLLEKDFINANAEIENIEIVSSQLIALALLNTNANKKTKDYVLSQSSKFGYKKAVLYLLKLQQSSADTNEKRKIDKTINILKSKE